VPVRVRDLAEVAIGKELRTGSASVDGREVVLGTALMLIGGNSRAVAAAADAKIREMARHYRRESTPLRFSIAPNWLTPPIHTVAKNLAEGALLVIAVLFVLLGNFRAALVTVLVIPVTMLVTASGMLQDASARTS
jgi:cobalt-zinc-cadmium resistance protein CzcA